MTIRRPPQWAILLVLIAQAAVVLIGLSKIAEAKPKPVKAGSFFTVTCPAGTEAHGGTVTWLDKRGKPIGTSAGEVTGPTTVRFGPAPKGAAAAEVTVLDCRPPPTTTTVAPTTTTTVAPTTTTTTTLPPDPNVYLTGTVTVTDQGYIVYAPAADNIPGAVSCPAGTRLDFAASTFSNPTEVAIQFFPTFNWIIATTIDQPTPTEPNVERELTFRIVCVPA
jgi:hypothetical protein